jgi:putative transcriptional regulator
MSNISSFSNMLLVAMPSMKDPNFRHTVIYVCEHQPEGAVGLIINRPMQFPIAMIFEQLNIQPIRVQLSTRPLLYGGPIQPERGFVIHKQLGPWQSSLNLREDVTITTSNDIIRAIAVDEGPADLLVTLGFTGWSAQQLEDEVKNDSWIICPFKPELVYEVPFEDRWLYAGSLIGIDMNQLTSQSGHA